MQATAQARRALFIRTDRLGETLLNLPAVAALREALPRASLTLLVHPDLQSLFTAIPGIDHVLADEPASAPWWIRAARLSRTLKPHRFDLAVVSNPKKELHAAVWLAGIPTRIGYHRKWGRWLLTHRLEDRKALGERHEVDYNLDLIRVLGISTAAAPRLLPPLPREQADVLHLLEQQGLDPARPFVAVHPWTSNPAKQWPLERFASVIEIVTRRLAMPVVLIGGSQERSRASSLPARRGAVANLVGALTLTQLAALLQRATLLVSNDSGPVHLAAAVGTRTLVLFGSTDAGTGPGRWGPWGAGHTVIANPSMDAIRVEDVVASLERLLPHHAQT